MKRVLDKIVVLDLEATCWDGPPPPGEQSEIIEIGVCLLDVKTGRRDPAESVIVRPERSAVSDYCTRLTTLTQADVAAGISFDEACALLEERFASRRRTFASYGAYDRFQLQAQCDMTGVHYPFGPTHLNVKNLFALRHRLRDEVSLAQAFTHMGWRMEGTYHRGSDDAWNIARLLAVLLGHASAGTAPETESYVRD
jgi:inhibitor of KinA sporulation pathway (predicted exonuclease)